MDAHTQQQATAVDHGGHHLSHFSQSRQSHHHHHDACHHAQAAAQQAAKDGVWQCHRAGGQLWRRTHRDRRPQRAAAVDQWGSDSHQFLGFACLAVPDGVAVAHMVAGQVAALACGTAKHGHALSWRRHAPQCVATTAHALCWYWRIVVHPNLSYHHQVEPVHRRPVRVGRVMDSQRGFQSQTDEYGCDGAPTHATGFVLW